MKPQLLSFLLIAGTLLSCGKKSDDVGPAGSHGKTTATLKVTRDGKTITDFKTSTAFFIADDHYAVTIDSPEKVGAGPRSSMLLTITGNTAGTYSFGDSAQNSGAGFLLFSYDLVPPTDDVPGMLGPNDGELKLTTATTSRCAGSFKATGGGGPNPSTYTIEGTFDIQK